ncbi:sarcosine oxidase subunit gamma [Rhizobium straminoryzae]|uniref:Sarcosine oxidase subunit gamma family protein n=1 Tax=Rhizobium straminoryzae TaxID=1387186 RepID=A0A549TCQ9_9HYPH|nr:sarcosine oxidase subunit gamma [Rhizobium straminoryzae]TRL39674.1 sarcosine oxidase subunit gamma family protein [Rhizobium straminoryzae]
MAELATRTLPLAGAYGGSPAVQLQPARPAARISLRARPDAVEALSAALGLSLPTAPKTSATGGGRTALWLGPDEWLVIDEGDSGLMQATAASGAVHSATDVSHRNTAILVSGPGASQALNAGCPLDLSLKAFPVGACARTLFGKIEVVLLRTGPDAFRLECWRSFSDYAFGLLAEAATDAEI